MKMKRLFSPFWANNNNNSTASTTGQNKSSSPPTNKHLQSKEEEESSSCLQPIIKSIKSNNKLESSKCEQEVYGDCNLSISEIGRSGTWDGSFISQRLQSVLASKNGPLQRRRSKSTDCGVQGKVVDVTQHLVTAAVIGLPSKVQEQCEQSEVHATLCDTPLAGCSASAELTSTMSISENSVGSVSDGESKKGVELTNNISTDIVEAAIKKRTYVIRELVETERDYVNDLKEIVEGYMAIMRDPLSDIPMPEDLRGGKDKIIFGNLEAIYEWHRDIFCNALERCLETPQELGPLFKRYERKLHMYVVYCRNKPMSEFIVSEHIETYLEEIRLRLGHALTLCDLLIKPVQRIMKYQLFLRDTLKYTERIGLVDEIEMLKHACNVMHVVPKEANDMMTVGRLQGFDGKITAQGKLLLSGLLLCSEGSSAQNVKGKELQVFFFEQNIIFSESVGKKTQFSNPIYIYKAHIQVNQMSLTETVDHGDLSKFLLSSTDPRKPNLSFICQASSRECRDDWVSKLQSTLQNQKDFVNAIQSPIKYQNNKLTKT